MGDFGSVHCRNIIRDRVRDLYVPDFYHEKAYKTWHIVFFYIISLYSSTAFREPSNFLFTEVQVDKNKLARKKNSITRASATANKLRKHRGALAMKRARPAFKKFMNNRLLVIGQQIYLAWSWPQDCSPHVKSFLLALNTSLHYNW